MNTHCLDCRSLNIGVNPEGDEVCFDCGVILPGANFEKEVEDYVFYEEKATCAPPQPYRGYRRNRYFERAIVKLPELPVELLKWVRFLYSRCCEVFYVQSQHKKKFLTLRSFVRFALYHIADNHLTDLDPMEHLDKFPQASHPKTQKKNEQLWRELISACKLRAVDYRLDYT